MIRCIITDDEPIAAKGIQAYAEKTGLLEVMAVCENALELNAALKQHPVELLFLDIEMPYMTGIQFLKNYPAPPKVIFTTAYEQYAIQGFELDVLDYLLKPISFERFMKAANKAHDYFSAQQPTANQPYLFIKADSRLEKVFFEDIFLVEGTGNYVTIYTGSRKIITHLTLKSVMDNLPPAQFLQTHKSFIVNTHHISAGEGNILHVGKYEVPISKYQKEEILEKVLNNRLLRK